MVNKIGNYEIHSVQTGLFKLDGGAMFGVVPKSWCYVWCGPKISLEQVKSV